MVDRKQEWKRKELQKVEYEYEYEYVFFFSSIISSTQTWIQNKTK